MSTVTEKVKDDGTHVLATKHKASDEPAKVLRVRAISNVLGLNHGDEVEMADSPRVQVMLNAGHLVELDEDGEPVSRLPEDEAQA